MRSIPASLITAIAVIVGSHLPVAAEEQPPAEVPAPPSPSPARRGPRPGDVQKVFVLAHTAAGEMAEILAVFPADIRTVDHPRETLAVSAAPAVVAAIEETIKRLDVPPAPAKSVDVTGYVLECSKQAADDGVPAELQDAIVQLKRTFGYAGCALAQTLLVRARADSSFRSRAAKAMLSAAQLVVDTSQSPAMVRLQHLTYQDPRGPHFSSSVDVRDGQRVILGKLGSVENGKDEILVLTADVLD
jgi:hypothetical protein